MKKIALMFVIILIATMAFVSHGLAFDVTQIKPDIHGTILKPFDVDTGTSNDMDYLNIESKHGTWLMDVEGGIRYMNARAFVGYETTTRIDRKESAGAEYFITPNIAVRVQGTKHTLYGHGPVRTRYVAGGVSFNY